MSSPLTSSSSSQILLKGLNEAQRGAVTQPLEAVTRVVAGPGAGKTRVLTSRIAHLLQETDSDRILAVTFTKKAAHEMQERLNKLLENIQGNDSFDPHDGEMPLGLERTTMGTFHSICAKILRYNGQLLSDLPAVKDRLIGSEDATALDGSFAIVDQSEQLRIVKDQAKELSIEIPKEIRPLTIVNKFPKIRNKEESPEDDGKAWKIARQLYPHYQSHLYASNSVDFDDLMFLTRELLQTHSTIRNRLRQRAWNHVLVDEFQDTSKVQLDLVKLWTDKSLLIVGDADQSIYSWRGAHVESMQDFERDFPNVDTLYLMENYRSTTNIVQAAQKVIAGGEDKGDQNKDLLYRRQDMKPMRGEGSNLHVQGCANARVEASYVVRTILDMISSNKLSSNDKNFGETSTVAILYRTNAQSRAIEEACVEYNLPYVIMGSATSFYNRLEIKDCLCFLRWIHNGRDQQAMLRAVKTPSRGIGSKAIDEFQEYHQQVVEFYNLHNAAYDNGPSPPSLLDTLLALIDVEGAFLEGAPHPEQTISKRALNKFLPFAQQIYEIRNKASEVPVSNLMSYIVETLDLKRHFDTMSKSTSEFEDRWNNVQELIQASTRYSKDGAAIPKESARDDVKDDDDNMLNSFDSPLGKFLDDVSLVTDLADQNSKDEENEVAKQEPQPIKAKLMTVHASKGMEFNAVFVVGNEDGTFPLKGAIDKGPKSVELDEERRLCYVAMTRAKDFLTMTWRRNVVAFGTSEIPQSVSRFLVPFVPAEERGKSPKQDAGRPFGSRPQSKFPNYYGGNARFKSTNNYWPRRPQQQTRRSSTAPQIQREREMYRYREKPSVWKPKGRSQRRSPTRQTALQQKPQRRSVRKVNRLQDATAKRQPRDNKKNDGNNEMDSTWFYPVGSNVVHAHHGRGKVMTPPPDQDGQMMVRVKFDTTGEEMEFSAMGSDLLPN